MAWTLETQMVGGKGGFLPVDEIEQSLSGSLIVMLVGFFTSPRTNPHGARLAFTTHRCRYWTVCAGTTGCTS